MERPSYEELSERNRKLELLLEKSAKKYALLKKERNKLLNLVYETIQRLVHYTETLEND